MEEKQSRDCSWLWPLCGGGGGKISSGGQRGSGLRCTQVLPPGFGPAVASSPLLRARSVSALPFCPLRRLAFLSFPSELSFRAFLPAPHFKFQTAHENECRWVNFCSLWLKTKWIEFFRKGTKFFGEEAVWFLWIFFFFFVMFASKF